MTTRRQWRTALALLVLCTGTVAAAGTAQADAFGQLAHYGTSGNPGSGAGQLWSPTELGVDVGPDAASDADDTVYVMDMAPLDGSTERLQQLSRAGATFTPTASATLPFFNTLDTNGNPPGYGGVVVDRQRQRVYVLEFQFDQDGDPGGEAKQIRVYSTQPDGGGHLVAPADVPSGVLPLPDPNGSNAIFSPSGFALDPTTGDLLISGYDAPSNVARDVIVQRIGADGTVGDRYVDDHTVAHGSYYQNSFGLAVASDGTVYLAQGSQNSRVYVYSLTPAFDSISKLVEDFDPITLAEGWFQLGVAQPFGSAPGQGAQLAIAPDDSTLYWSETVSPSGGIDSGPPGNYVVRGYSLANSATSVVYGGYRAGVADHTADTCEIAGRGAALAPSGPNLYVVDPGDFWAATPTYGGTLTEYGPGGSGCPAPVASYRVGASDDLTVTKGDNVRFDASASELHGATPSEVDWDLDGSGAFATVRTGTPAPLTLDHTFTRVGTFRVGMRIVLTGSPLGNPPVVTRTITVRPGIPTATFRASTSTPAAGATVRFDAGQSSDPTGSPSAGPTNELRSYSWDFGDGTRQTTSTPTVEHAFANAASAAVRRTVTLTVTSFDNATSPAVTQTLTVQGTPPPPMCATDASLCPPPARTCATDASLCPPPLVPDPGNTTLVAAKLRGTSAALTLRCAATPGACSGAVTLVATLPAPSRGRRARRARAKATIVGRASFVLAAGGKVTLNVKLSKAARALLASRHKLKLSIRIETRNSAGARRSSSKTATLVLPARRGTGRRSRR